MSGELLMPQLGLTMTEGTLQEWMVQPGDRYIKGQVLFVVETEKAANEIEALTEGTLLRHEIGEGETVPVGTVVAIITEQGEERPNMAVIETIIKSKKAIESAPKADIRKVSKPELIETTGATEQTTSQRIYATPLARRQASQNDISLDKLTGTGARGMIKIRDVKNYLQASNGLKKPAIEQIQRVQPSPVQKAMARRLASVKQGTPHFYLSTEVDMTNLLLARQELNSENRGAKVTLTHFLLMAIGNALEEFPNINRCWDKNEIVQYSSSHIAVAVETNQGLYVPVVRDVAEKSLSELILQTNRMIEKARAIKLTAAEMEGCSTTLSNAGMYDVTWLTPIINLGQSSILGTGSVREIFRPDENGKPVLKKEMGVVFSGDHRVHTGVEGLKYLNRIKSLLESPLILLGVNC
ncbi:MAG: dihydrolipoamide acetyltransferase family protein [Pseudomonadales bacterium]|jgi:pyruvate dehydrogenase E2 component (dihydrolipoamide acetyltransferase)